MDAEQSRIARGLFDKAVQLPAEKRAEFLDAACPDDEVRAAVEELLGQHDSAAPTAIDPSDLATSVEEVLEQDDSAAPTVIAPSDLSTATEVSTSGGRGRTIGPYRLISKLGEGGMGIVWRAEQSAPVRRTVALKLIKHGLDSAQVLARFESERQALALMNHPNVARVLDAGTDPSGAPYFAMEYIKGDPINSYCDRNNLCTTDRLELMIQVCEGIQHAHQKGIIHRDIKPSNILVEIQDGRAIPRIIDFGVAKAIDRQLTERTLFTEFGQVLGTPEYMSPEQAEMTGVDIDTRTDVYSLGVVLYELLVGSLPFESRALRSAGIDEMRRIIREETPPQPSIRISIPGEHVSDAAGHRQSDPATLSRTCRGDLDWITMKALEKDRTQRYGSVSDLAADLRHHLANEPVSAGPPTLGYRARKFVRRHRLGVSVAATLLGAVLLGLAGTTYGMLRALRAERQARLEVQTTERVSQFMFGMFEINDPGEARGRSITALEILDRGVEQIRDDLVDEPALRGRMLESMGTVYRGLGLYEDAVPLLEGAVDGTIKAHGENHPRVAEYLNRLSGLLILRGRGEEALPLLERALSIQQHALSADDPERGRTLNNLAAVHKMAKRYGQALPYARQALEARERSLGLDHRDVAKTLINLGQIQAHLGRHDEAGSAYERALAMLQATLGEDHPEALNLLNSIGGWQYRQGEHDEARETLQGLIKIQERVLGHDHPDLVYSLATLGQVENARGDAVAYRNDFERAVEIGEAKLEPGHPLVVGMARRLIELARERGDEAAALEFERKVRLWTREASGSGG